MSTIVFAGRGPVRGRRLRRRAAWRGPAIILLTALLNARHLLYSAALAPWLREVPFARRAVDGPSPDRRGLRAGDQPLPADRPDRRTGLLDRGDRGDLHPVEPRRRWPGSCSAAQIPDPARLGIDIIFPAAMIGLAVGLITGRRELVAAIVGGVRRRSSSRWRRARRSGSSPAASSGRWSGCSSRRRSRRRPRRSARPHRPTATRCPARTSRREPDPPRAASGDEAPDEHRPRPARGPHVRSSPTRRGRSAC